MPNICSRKRVPRYRLHKPSGQAVVTIDGKDIYLGKHGSTASRDEYKERIETWKKTLKRPTVAVVSPRHKSTITEIVVAYVVFADGYYRKDKEPTNEVRMIKSALKVVRQIHGRTYAVEFGPLALKECRNEMIRLNWCRSHINKQVDRIKRMLKWATENEMIPGTVYEALRCVAGLKRGRTDAREGRKVKPISDADVMATLEHLPPVVAGMVQVQRFTGARPGEICDMRPGDINRKADPWEYVPRSHKTEHHDRPRVIFVGPKAQKILLPYLLRPADAYCFSPREAEGKRRAAQHEARKTPISCGNKPGSNVKPKPRRTAGEKYDRNSYGRAIRRAAQKANVGIWSPHRLRHSFATEVRKQFGLEAVQVALGHSKANTSEIYAERDFAKAAFVARQIG
jgi:integrase